jgi:hypothetical protein
MASHRARNAAIRAGYERRHLRVQRERRTEDFVLMTRANGDVGMLACLVCGNQTSDLDAITFRYCSGCDRFLDPATEEVGKLWLSEGGLF